MLVQPYLAPLHEGHEGGGLFDAYNITVGLIVLAILGLVAFILYRIAQRRRED